MWQDGYNLLRRWCMKSKRENHKCKMLHYLLSKKSGHRIHVAVDIHVQTTENISLTQYKNNGKNIYSL